MSTQTPTPSSVKLSFKRPAVDVQGARKKQRRVTTPTSETQFKIPALPTRALTPSTSTVAASSSPRRNLSSSPTREVEAGADGKIENVTVAPGQPLIFGRHRHRPAASSSPGPSSVSDGLAISDSTVLLKSSVPVHLHHLVTDINSCASTIYLSRYASHASRTHAMVEYLESTDSLRILVIGQNGLRVGGKRILAGQRVEVERKDRLMLDFYGAKVALRFPQVKSSEPEANKMQMDIYEEMGKQATGREALFTPEPSSPLAPALSSPLPPSSPPLAPTTPMSMDMDVDEEGGEQDAEGESEEEIPVQDLLRSSPPLSPAPSRASSPLSAASDEEEEAEEDEDEEDEEGCAQVPAVEDEKSLKIKIELVEAATSRHSTPPKPVKPLEEDIEPIPSGVDLPALLASTVVFSGSSKLSLPDLVKHMLDSQPSLKTHGNEEKWNKWGGSVLAHNPMFGKVERHGKDSSGHPLLPHYYYNPANDPDQSRAQELGVLVRPLRTVQRAGGKAIDWRPVGSGRRRY